MKQLRSIFPPLLILVLVLTLMLASKPAAVSARPASSATAFTFVFSADSRDNYTVLPDLSHKMVTLNPVFGFFGGDLCGSFDVTCINNTWKPAMDGNNSDGMLAKTFVTRGNHDSGTLSTWQGLWDFQSMAARVGATNFSALTSETTYSFDYGNSHFVLVDSPGGANTWTSAEISWFDADLTAAEGRGVVHEFLFSHGPMYGVTSEHGSEYPSAALKAVLNKHPISAGFHGHEHVSQYTDVTPSFESGINNYQEFTFGRAGAPAYSVVKATTWHSDTNAFVGIAVNGNQFTVTAYSQSGSVLYTKTLTDGSPAPTSTPTSTPAATSTPGATSTPNPTSTSTSTPAATSTPGATSTPKPTSTATFTPGPTSTPKPTATPGGPTPTPGTTYTVTYYSTGSYDGHILESSKGSGVGGTLVGTSTAFKVGDDSSNRQYRSILSFNTAGLPDNAVITSVTLKIHQANAVGSSPFSTMGNIMADIMTGSFSGSSTLQLVDFQAAPSKSSVMSIGNTPVSGVYTKSMSSTYFGYVSKTGITQLRLRFATPTNANNTSDYLSFYSGDYTTTASYQPALVIKYTLP